MAIIISNFTVDQISPIPSYIPNRGPVNTIHTIAIITAYATILEWQDPLGNTPYSTTKLTVFMTKGPMQLSAICNDTKLQILVNRLWFRVQLGSVWTGGSTEVPKWGTEVRYQIERWSAGHLDRPHGQQNVW